MTANWLDRTFAGSVPSGVVNDVVGLDGEGGLKNLGPAITLPDSPVAGDMFFWNGTILTQVAGPKTDGFVLSLVGGVPTWVGGGGGLSYAALINTFLVWYDLSVCTQGAGIVTALPDQTANGNNAIFPAGEEPAYVASDAALNNLPTMHFTGTKRVDMPDLGLGAEPFTVVFVAYETAASNPAVFTASDGNVECVRPGTKWAVSGDATTTTLADPSINMTTPAVVVVVYNGDGTGKLYVNAKTPTTGNVTAGGAGTPNMTGVTLCLGHYAILPANAGFSLEGPISHFGVYQGALSNADCGTILDGLGALAGISIGA